jgi:predicted transposase YbfD/YdcC
MGGYQELYTLFKTVTDPRGRQGRDHILAEVLFVTFVAVLAGSNNAEAVVDFLEANEAWFRKIVLLPGGVPAHDTVLRVLAVTKPEELERVLRTWVDAMRAPGVLTREGGQVAFDGKTLRGSLDKSSGLGGVHMVGAYLIDAGLTLGTIKVDDKSNEITAIPDLIRALNLEGATVTIDAMGCQTAIAGEIIEAGADYVLQVKGNQPTLEANIRSTFAEALRRRRPGEPKPKLDRYKEVDKGHGRIEQRTCVLSRDLSLIENAADWPGLSGLGMMAREVQHVTTGKVTKELAYFILSRKVATAQEIGATIRNHWGIETTLHWSLDVTFGEDGHRIVNRNGAENLSRLRRLAHGMVKQATGHGMSMTRVRQVCGWTPDRLLDVLSGEVIARKPKVRKLDPKRYKSVKTK